MSARVMRRSVACTQEEPAAGSLRSPLRTVPRAKTSLTSFCASSDASYALPGRDTAIAYRFSRECFCLSPEHHAAQFLGAQASRKRYEE